MLLTVKIRSNIQLSQLMAEKDLPHGSKGLNDTGEQSDTTEKVPKISQRYV